MMKTHPEYDQDQLQLYYTALVKVKIVYKLISQRAPDRIILNNVIEELMENYNQLKIEFAEDIKERIKAFEHDAISNRQISLCRYLRENAFFHLKSDRDEELENIVSMPLEYNPTRYPILMHQSIYNEENNQEALTYFLKGLTSLSDFEQYFYWLKDYYKDYDNAITTVMDELIFLPKDWKYYIAIMSVSTVRNKNLLHQLEEDFLFVGGDPAWLINGNDVIPTKLKSISKLNNIIANQPWKLQSEELTKLRPVWNLNELAEAAIIIIQYHQLALIDESLLVLSTKEIPHTMTGFDNNRQNSFLKKILEIQKAEAEVVQGTMDSNGTSKTNGNSNNNGNSNKCFMTQESFKALENEEKKIIEDDASLEYFNKYLSNEYKDYASEVIGNEPSCTYLDFNWLDNGIYIMKNLFPSGTTIIDQEISKITNLTSDSIGTNEMVSTNPFKKAVALYTEKLFGYYYEDYNYSTIKDLLKPAWKNVIKKIACYPKQLNTNDINEMNKVFKIEEVVHLIVLVVTMKMKIQLIYFARELNNAFKDIE